MTTFIIAFSNSDKWTTTIFLLTFLILYLALHASIQPFQYSGLNIMESICIISLTLITITARANPNSESNDIFITIAIILPFIALVLYLIKIISFICKSYTDQSAFSESDIQYIEQIKLRSKHLFNVDLDNIINKTNQTATGNNNDEDEMKIQTNNPKQIELTEMPKENANANAMSEIDNETVCTSTDLQPTEMDQKSEQSSASNGSESEFDEPS
eukprot:305579_1